MLFNSYAFILFYLPIVLVGFYILAGWAPARAAAAWLAVGSLFFYGYWDARYLALLGGSIACNYILAIRILAARRSGRARSAKALLFVAVSLNLGTLAYFKYFNFLVDTLNHLAGPVLDIAHVALPIGISFFTFTQIAFLVDTYQGKAHETNPVHYALFVTYFPHLIAGPILHHSEMMPQFAHPETYRLNIQNFTNGLALFTMGLSKKVILADGIQPFVGPVFDSPPTTHLNAVAAWGGALAYSMQLYFDFSGYSDMAVGLSRMFNIELPLNFNSPYKARNIVEFWRRWHMTLSRFLRDYLYFPLGGNRRGRMRRYVNLMITMLLGGLWHGAGWTFVVWGGLHGMYLIVNHAWDAARASITKRPVAIPPRLARVAGIAVTFLAVTVAWIFFRAPSFESALNVLAATAHLSDLAGAVNSPSALLESLQVSSSSAIAPIRQVFWTVGLMMIAFAAPNSQEIMLWLKRWLAVQGSRSDRICALLTGSLVAQILVLAAINASRGVSEFIYFNF